MTTDHTTPDTSTVVGDLQTLQTLAIDTRAQIDANWEAQQIERETAERRNAVSNAVSYVQRAFPNTLAKVIDPQAWIGYRGLDALQDGTETLASAITYLGDGLWFRHVSAPGLGTMGAPFDVLTLWFACGCGNYIGAVIGEEYDLADVLADLDHSECADACEPSTALYGPDDDDEDYEDEGRQVEDVIADLAHYDGPIGRAS